MPKKGGGGGERRTGRTSIIKIVSQITYGNKRAASEERPPAVKESGIKKKKTNTVKRGLNYVRFYANISQDSIISLSFILIQ